MSPPELLSLASHKSNMNDNFSALNLGNGIGEI